MELRHLRTLDAVARHGSFTRAAAELHLAQSAVSQQIRRLEAELGVDLLRRTSRRVDVTEAGEVVLDYARASSRGRRPAGRARGPHRGPARQGRDRRDLADRDLRPPGVLGSFHRRHPGVVIHLLEDTADHLLGLLRRDEIDCAYASVDPDRLGEEFAATKLFEEELVVAVAPGHRFAGQDHVTFEQLAGETLIAYREGSELRRRIEATMAAHDLTPNNGFFCTEMAAVRALASRGSGSPSCRARSPRCTAPRSSPSRSAPSP
jgi:DNA-binding transcriptional LysR family regulator